MPLFPDVDLENYLRSLVNFPEVTENEELRERQEKAAGLSDSSKDTNQDPQEGSADNPEDKSALDSPQKDKEDKNDAKVLESQS
jgi:hypothetical protein